MTAQLSMGSRLFGGGSRQRPQPNRQPPAPKNNRKFFMGQDYNSAAEFLKEVGIDWDRSWDYLHNIGSTETISGGVLYVCPGAEMHPEFDAIRDAVLEKGMKMIFIITIETKEMQ